MRRLAASTIVVAFVLPLSVAALAAGSLRAGPGATRLRALTAGVPVAACLVTGVAWFFLFHSGIFYPVFDAGDLQNSWGGPTLAGAWAVHLALALGLLLVVAFPFALWRAGRQAVPAHRASPNHPDPGPTRALSQACERSQAERRKKR